jgi:hypothetical protein
MNVDGMETLRGAIVFFQAGKDVAMQIRGI